MASEITLLEVGVLFGAVALVGVLAARVRQSVIPFYIGVGMLLNPYVAGRVAPYALEETEFIEIGAELGVVFLLLFLGFEFNLQRLFENAERIGKAGTVDLALNFGVGLALGYVIFRSAVLAFIVAGIVYISSSAIITKSLIDLGWIANDEADPMLGTLVYEDLVIAVYLVVLSALLLGGDVDDAARSLGLAVGFLIALLLFITYGTPFFQRLLETSSKEFTLLRAVAVTVLVAGAALAIGVSEAVAAFFIGLAFSSTDHVQELEELLEPIRDLFTAVFFFWIGLITDPLQFGPVLGTVAAAVVVTTPTKLASGYFGGRIYDLDARRSTRVALGMTTRGEFSLIIATMVLGASGSIVSEEAAQSIYGMAVGYVLVMSVFGTTLMQYSRRIESVVLRSTN